MQLKISTFGENSDKPSNLMRHTAFLMMWRERSGKQNSNNCDKVLNKPASGKRQTYPVTIIYSISQRVDLFSKYVGTMENCCMQSGPSICLRARTRRLWLDIMGIVCQCLAASVMNHVIRQIYIHTPGNRIKRTILCYTINWNTHQCLLPKCTTVVCGT